MQSDDFTRCVREHTEKNGILWNDEFWLKNNFLDNNTVMQYFYLSVFYDKKANNEKVKEELSLLKTMRGLEFAMVHSIPDLGVYHIRKQYRHSEKKVTSIALYYVMSGKIYEAPSIYRVFSVKLRNIAHSLDQALTQIAGLSNRN